MIKYVITCTYRHKHYRYHDKVVNYEIDVDKDVIYIKDIDLMDVQDLTIRRVGCYPSKEELENCPYGKL